MKFQQRRLWKKNSIVKTINSCSLFVVTILTTINLKNRACSNRMNYIDFYLVLESC